MSLKSWWQSRNIDAIYNYLKVVNYLLAISKSISVLRRNIRRDKNINRQTELERTEVNWTIRDPTVPGWGPFHLKLYHIPWNLRKARWTRSVCLVHIWLAMGLRNPYPARIPLTVRPPGGLPAEAGGGCEIFVRIQPLQFGLARSFTNLEIS